MNISIQKDGKLEIGYDGGDLDKKPVRLARTIVTSYPAEYVGRESDEGSKL